MALMKPENDCWEIGPPDTTHRCDRANIFRATFNSGLQLSYPLYLVHSYQQNEILWHVMVRPS